jgi:pyruvate/2-oxoglutarate dehydrogenase complex dihydrolipoamide dehydrogenase (E3) component
MMNYDVVVCGAGPAGAISDPQEEALKRKSHY